MTKFVIRWGEGGGLLHDATATCTCRAHRLDPGCKRHGWVGVRDKGCSELSRARRCKRQPATHMMQHSLNRQNERDAAVGSTHVHTGCPLGMQALASCQRLAHPECAPLPVRQVEKIQVRGAHPFRRGSACRAILWVLCCAGPHCAAAGRAQRLGSHEHEQTLSLGERTGTRVRNIATERC